MTAPFKLRLPLTPNMKKWINWGTPIIGLLLIALALATQGKQNPNPNTKRKPPDSDLWLVLDVYDGDTVKVGATDGSGTQETIRLCGIDAPEKNQPLGIEARNYLQSLINKGEGEVMVTPVERDRYGRLVAELAVIPKPGQGYQPEEEIFINGDMIQVGMAWHYAQYSSNCPNQQVLMSAEEIAKSRTLGIQKPGNVPPWEFRKNKRASH